MPRSLYEPFDVGIRKSKSHDVVEIEVEKGCSKVLPLGLDRTLAQTGLKTFQAKLFE
ncbi:UNVERIFIED_ORG: hypothetical protein GGD51_000573 [Rhizobium esperanzae]